MKCELCGSDRRDTIRYGEFLSKNRKGVHTNCLYLSSGLHQNGSEDEGFLGFLPRDIEAERKRVSKTQCCYCRKMYANIGCCEVRCYRTFHMICGIEHGAMNQFLDTFRSFCDRHVRKVPSRPKPDEECCICYEKIFAESRRFSAANMIRAPCCRNGWFHKYCLQKFAKNAGYFFKCPLCNDSQKFKTSMSCWGVFVQDKDAEWELVPNAYAELLERPNVCGAQICKNPEGRGQSSDENPFQYCVTCGSVAIHRRCVTHRDNSYECDTCQRILNSDSGHESLNSQQQYANNENERVEPLDEDETSDVDVCEEDSDAEILRPKIKNKNPLRILNETEDTSASDDESDVIIMPSTRKIQANKPYIIDDTSTESITDIVELDCSKDEILSASGDEAKCSVDEELVNAFERTEKPQSSCLRKKESIDMNKNISSTGQEQRTDNKLKTKSEQQESTTNTSFIAQRTRRKSIAARPPIDEAEVADGSSSSISNQSSRPYQVFQYDDEDDSATQSAAETEDNKFSSSSFLNSEIGDPNESKAYSGQGLLDYFYALLLEVKQENKDEKVALANSGQTFSNRVSTREMVKNQANSALDVSCIANRTRRRLSGKVKNMPNRVTSASYEETDDEDKESISTNSSLRQPMFDSLNVSCIAKRTRKRLSNIDVIKVDDTKFDNVLNVPIECVDTKDEKINNAKAEQHCSNREERLKLDKEEIHENIKNEGTNSLDVSCIANRTRRRFFHKLQSIPNRIASSDFEEINLDDTPSTIFTEPEVSYKTYFNKSSPRNPSSIADIIEEEAKLEKADELVVTSITEHMQCETAFNIGQNNTANNSSASSYPNELASSSNTARSSTESFKSSTYFGRSYEYSNENYNDSNCQTSAQDCFKTNVISLEPRVSTSTSNSRAAVMYSSELTQKRKSRFDSPIPQKIPALPEDESEPELQRNILEHSCIANRTRRKSVDFNKFKQMVSAENHKVTFNLNCKEKAYESEPENQTNVLEQSCIANRTRRKSVDFNKFKQMVSAEKHKETFTINSKEQVYESEPENQTNIFEQSCIANRTRRKSVDLNKLKHTASVDKNRETIDTYSKEQTVSSGSMFSSVSWPESRTNHTTAIRNLSTQTKPFYTVSTSDVRHQRTPIHPHRFRDDNHDSERPQISIVHSPKPNKISWSDKNDAYIMPRYTRVNGKLKRISTETFQMQRQSQTTTCQTVDAQIHFARSYNLLLQTPNDNHRRISSSRT